MKRASVAVALVLMFATSELSARQLYAGYEGPDAVQTGQGGAKIVKNGIDYWTNGSPPRRFQILGILTDARSNRPFDGSAIGSKSVAKVAIDAGGDAVILGDRNSHVVGVSHENNLNFSGNSAFGSGFSRVVRRTTTQILVIKYLPAE
jgi:hypothetical protein